MFNLVDERSSNQTWFLTNHWKLLIFVFIHISLITKTESQIIDLYCYYPDNCNKLNCQCQPQGQPIGQPYSINWIFEKTNGVEKNLSSFSVIEGSATNGNMKSLLYYDLEREDQGGKVFCVVENNIPINKSNSVIVKYISEIDVASINEIYIFNISSNFFIPCNVYNSYPYPSVYWIGPNEEIIPRHNLSFNNINKNQAGNYTCVAKNCAGNVTRETQIIVQAQPERPTNLKIEYDSEHLLVSWVPGWDGSHPQRFKLSFGIDNVTEVAETTNSFHKIKISEIKYNTMYSFIVTPVTIMGVGPQSDIAIFKTPEESDRIPTPHNVKFDSKKNSLQFGRTTIQYCLQVWFLRKGSLDWAIEKLCVDSRLGKIEVKPGEGSFGIKMCSLEFRELCSAMVEAEEEEATPPPAALIAVSVILSLIILVLVGVILLCWLKLKWTTFPKMRNANYQNENSNLTNNIDENDTAHPDVPYNEADRKNSTESQHYYTNWAAAK